MRTTKLASPAVLAAILSIVAISCLGCADNDNPGDHEANVVAHVQALMRHEQVPGVAAAIVTRNSIVWEKAFGYANLDTKRAANTDTPFTLASVSKTVLGAAVMKTIEQGCVTLDTEINTVGLPFAVDNPNIANEHVQLRHLVTHTSGILDDFDATNLSGSYTCSYYVEADSSPLAALLAPATNCPNPAITALTAYLEAYLVKDGALYSATKNYAADPPGTAWSYSNVGAALAGRVLEAAAGKPLDAATEQWLFKPLAMNNTHWHRSDFVDPRAVATEYMTSQGEPIELPTYSLATWPDGGLRSSAHDFATFAGAILNGGSWQGTRVLSEQSVKTMLSAQTDVTTGDPTMKQGIFWVDLNGSAYHNGADPGTTTAIELDPTRTVGVVLMMNLQVTDQSAVQSLLADLMALGHYLAG
jgi:CubicO group peptidase (beta-lactamase class C family)